MQRREFLAQSIVGSGMLAEAAAPLPAAVAPAVAGDVTVGSQVVIERSVPGRPHAGKVLATIAPHSDDHSILAGGTIAKLIAEGYTGYLIRTSNDEKDSFDLSLGQTVAANEADNQSMARVLGIRQVFDLNYPNHALDDVSRVELRARLIFLIRLLKIDTILSYDPWGHYEENPDHYVTAQCVEAACWMAGGHLDFPEHFAAGLKPHRVREKYYYARGPQLVNRVVDISSTIDQKLNAICTNRTMVGNMVRELQSELAQRKVKLPSLEGSATDAIRAYADLRFREGAAERGREYGLAYAEKVHYIGPDTTLDDYLRKHAVPI
jgi:LmbE family N-acetylglucosaminyl deacetylase